MNNSDMMDRLVDIDGQLDTCLQGFRNLEEFREYDRMAHDTVTLYKTVEELTKLNKELVQLLLIQTINKITEENPLL